MKRLLEERETKMLEVNNKESEVLIIKEQFNSIQLELNSIQLENQSIKLELESSQSKSLELELLYKSEKSKRHHAKLIGERLRLELRTRRNAEKWELGMIDVEDTKREINEVGLEFELGMLRMQVLVDKVEKEDLEVCFLSLSILLPSLVHIN